VQTVTEGGSCLRWSGSLEHLPHCLFFGAIVLGSSELRISERGSSGVGADEHGLATKMHTSSAFETEVGS
jgi:hypothetical protein